MSLEKITTKIPYVVSGFFTLTVFFFALSSLGIDLFLLGKDPCAGVLACPIRWSPLPLSLVLLIISSCATIVLLVVQLILHIISWFKKHHGA